MNDFTELRGSFERFLCVVRSSAGPTVGNIQLADRLISAVRAELGKPEGEGLADSQLAPDDLPPRVGHILRLAEIIREVDGKHDLGAAALAEAILAHPGFSGCHDAPVASAVSPVEPIPVVIGEAQNIGRDELYTAWYRCPNCKDDMIIRSSNFCPACGVKLQWEEGATHA